MPCTLGPQRRPSEDGPPDGVPGPVISDSGTLFFFLLLALSVSNFFLHLLEPSVAPKRSQLESIWEPSVSFSGGFLGFVVPVLFEDNILTIFIDF